MPSTNFEDLILRDIAASRPAAGIPGRLFFDTTNSKFQRDTGAAWEDCEGAGGSGDMLWATIQASQLTNEIKNFPANVANDADLDTLNLWWDSVGTPSTKVSFVDVSGEGGVTESFEYCLKCVADGAGEGFYQRYTYADEPRMKSGRVVSALVAIWSVGAINITAKLLNSDASETAAAAVSAAAWTIVEIPNHTLAGTYCDLQVTAGAAGTFYVVPLGLCIGARGVPLGPRPLRYVDLATMVAVINGVDPAGAGYTDLDLTANTSNLTSRVKIWAMYSNTSAVDKTLSVQRNGSSNEIYLARNSVATVYAIGCCEVECDDGQIIEWKTNGAAGNTEDCYIELSGYWEWA